MIPFDEAVAELRRDVGVAPEALERCEAILELQHASLQAEPPLARLPDSVRIAALARVRAGEIVIPRERLPVEARRVERLLRALANHLMPESALHDAAADFVENALPRALADDGAGVVREAEALGIPADASAALLREALKPELLRTTLPLSMVFEGMARARRCPTCGSRPCAATRTGSIACCSTCGTTWPWETRACNACGDARIATREIARVLRETVLVSCPACGEVVPAFPCSPDPLLLSLHAILAAPVVLSLRMAAEARPSAGFAIF